MITNERQYLITKRQAEQLRQDLARRMAADGSTLDQWALSAVRSNLQQRDDEIRSYEALRAGASDLRGAHLGTLLCQARIARGWSQRELAARLGLHMQEIQQYEATRYASASLTRLEQVAQALGCVLTIDVDLVPLPQLPVTIAEAAGGRGRANTAEQTLTGRLRGLLKGHQRTAPAPDKSLL